MPGTEPMTEALLVVDVVNDFDHEDGGALLTSFRARLPTMVSTLEQARRSHMPVLYANDAGDRWDADAPGLIRRAIEQGAGGEVVAALAPAAGDRFVFKPRYSAFDHTAVEPILRGDGVGRIFLAGAAVEGCVVQTAIDARELGFQVTIITSACATIDEELEQIALAYAVRVGGVHTVTSLTMAREDRLSLSHGAQNVDG